MAKATWLEREAPLLDAIAAAEEEDAEATSAWLTERTGLSGRDVAKGVRALATAGCVTADEVESMGDADVYVMDVELLERGRREVGAWPKEDAGLETFLALLAQRIEAEPDEEEKGRLRKLLDAAQGVGREVGTALLTAWAKSAAGLP